MTEAANWQDVKAKARAIDPISGPATSVLPGVGRCHEQMVASVSGAQLAEIRQ